MKLFNWINPLWIIDTFLTMRLEPITATSALGAMLGAGGTAAANAAITGAGIGALGGAATGSDPLKGALIGGALGGGGSLLGVGGGAAGSASEAVGSTAGAAIPGSIESAGLVLNPATGTYLNPAYFAGATSSLPLYTGAGSTLSQIGTGLGSLGSEINTGLGSLGGSALESLRTNPVQTAGLGMGVYDRINAQPQQMQAQPAQVSLGKGSVQYEPLLMTQVPRRRYPLSLLG
jgi:hypothetical protein